MASFLFFAIYFAIIIVVQIITKRIINNLNGEDSWVSKVKIWRNDPKNRTLYLFIRIAINIFAFIIILDSGFIGGAILFGILMGILNSLD